MLKHKSKQLLIGMLIIALIAPLIPSIGISKAAGSYILKVNKGTNVVTVYQNGIPVKAFVCSTGTDTPIGTFHTSQKLNWHVLQGNVYGQYCTRITGSILFHSVYYYQQHNKASQSYSAYNRLGSTASAGCVRLTVADAKWVYENTPIGTTVMIFYGNSSNDPLGKPAAIKVNSGSSMGWDPTDPDPANPYHAKNPTIAFRGNKKINVHSAFDPRAGLLAKDSAGNDITGKVQISGSVKTSKLGNYTISYTVTDAIGRSASLSVKFNVIDKNRPVFSGIMKNRKVQYGTKLNIKKNVKAKSYAGKNLTSKIRIVLKEPGIKTRYYKKSTITLKKLGKYSIKYLVKNPQNGKTGSKVVTINVVDTKKPKLTNIGKNKRVQYGARFNLRKTVKAKSAAGANLAKYIKVYVKIPGAGKYKLYKNKVYTFNKLGKYYVRYDVKNPQNKKSASQQITVTVVDTKKPTLSGILPDQTVEYNTSLDLFTSVKATAATGADIRKNLVRAVKAPDSAEYVIYKNKAYKFNKVGTYSIKYTLTNPKNNKTTTAMLTINVVDNSELLIKGIPAPGETKLVGETLDVRSGITAVTAAGGVNLTDQIKVSVTKDGSNMGISSNQLTFSDTGQYMITYTVQYNSKTTTQTRSISVN